MRTHHLDGFARGSTAIFAILATVVSACRDTPVDPNVLRLGFFSNVTHAPALTGVESGRFATALGPSRLETRLFNAGPAAIEAILAGALDATYVGPSPVLVAHVRSSGNALRVIAGVASGGALFVVRSAANIHSARDLHGKRLGTPQIGNTQDSALRSYLHANALETTDHGGDVTITPLANPDLLGRFRLGELDGAWVPEPWGSRLVAEAGGEILLDERDLWPNRRFPTTLLVVRQAYLQQAPATIRRLLVAHVAEIEFVRTHRAEAQALTNRALARWQGRPLPDALLQSAWDRIDFTTDPLAAALQTNAQRSRSLGFLARDDIHGLIDVGLLQSITASSNAR